MTFNSILFERPEDGIDESAPGMPDFFVDLNLNQIVDAIVAGREEYRLQPFFLAPLKSVDAIKYRHEIMQELEDVRLRDAIQSFASMMRTMRRYREISDKVHYRYGKEGWFLSAVEAYCEAVDRLMRGLVVPGLKSRGLSSFLGYLTSYVESIGFTSL